MNKKSFSIKYIATVLCLLIAFVMPFSALAAKQDSYSLTLRFRHGVTPVSGAHFSVYRIADGIDNGKIELKGDFEKYPVSLDELTPFNLKSAATLLSAYALRDLIKPYATGTTNLDGKLELSNIDAGVYLVVGMPVVKGNSLYIPQPCIVVVPSTVDGKVVNDVSVDIKHDFVSRKDPVKIQVIKVWEDADSATRPGEIVLQLLRDGVVYAEIILNSSNNWRFTWSDLDPSHAWAIVEKIVPSGYKVSISRDGITFVITNKSDSSEEETTTHPEESSTDPSSSSTDPSSSSTDPSSSSTDPSTTPTDPSSPSTDPSSPSTNPNTSTTNPDSSTTNPVSSTTNPDVTTTTNPDNTTTPGKKPSVLPNTGQLWWPVPVLSFAGFILFGVGFSKRKNGDEENA